MYCKMLYNDEPIVINRKAATILGVNEAIILQQIHYWLNINEKAKINFYDGRYWTYNTYEDWQKKDFPFLSARTLQRTFQKLNKEGILIKGNYNKAKYDRTLWITIDYEKLDKLLDEYEAKNEQNVEISTECQNGIMSDCNMSPKWRNGLCQNGEMDYAKMSSPIPKTNSEINSDICTTANVVVEDENKNINLIENKTHLKAMSKNMKNKVSKWDTERLEKAIDIFINQEGIYFSLLEKIYKDDRNFVIKSNDVPKVKTRFHNINESFRNYGSEELKEIVKQSQAEKFGNSCIHNSYMRAVKEGLSTLGEPLKAIVIEYAKSNNLDIPN